MLHLLPDGHWHHGDYCVMVFNGYDARVRDPAGQPHEVMAIKATFALDNPVQPFAGAPILTGASLIVPITGRFHWVADDEKWCWKNDPPDLFCKWFYEESERMVAFLQQPRSII